MFAEGSKHVGRHCKGKIRTLLCKGWRKYILSNWFSNVDVMQLNNIGTIFIPLPHIIPYNVFYCKKTQEDS